MQIMAISYTQMYSSPQNWRKQRNNPKPNNKFDTKRFITVHAVGVRSYTPNAYQRKKENNGKKVRTSKTVPRNFTYGLLSENRKKGTKGQECYEQSEKIVTETSPSSRCSVNSENVTLLATGDQRPVNCPAANGLIHSHHIAKETVSSTSSRKRPASKSPLLNTPSPKTTKLQPKSTSSLSKRTKLRPGSTGSLSHTPLSKSARLRPASLGDLDLSSDVKSDKIEYEIDNDVICFLNSDKRNLNSEDFGCTQKPTNESESQPILSQSAILALEEESLPKLSYDQITLQCNEQGELKILGEGMFGAVCRGKLFQNGRSHDIVAKIFNPKRSYSDDVFCEAIALHYLSCTGAVPKLYGIIEDDRLSELPVIVQECFADGQDFYKTIDKGYVSDKTWIKAFINAASGLAKIHHDLVLINDIKPDNVLMSEDGEIRYIDMGMATLNRGMRQRLGPSLENFVQLSPETRRGEETTTFSDIYSFGMMLHDVGNETGFDELVELSKFLTKDEPSERESLQAIQDRLKELLNRFTDN